MFNFDSPFRRPFPAPFPAPLLEPPAIVVLFTSSSCRWSSSTVACRSRTLASPSSSCWCRWASSRSCCARYSASVRCFIMRATFGSCPVIARVLCSWFFLAELYLDSGLLLREPHHLPSSAHHGPDVVTRHLARDVVICRRLAFPEDV